ncbi:MAG: hypothetical protein EBR82_43625 [Caulobacteraceae bacterium]|nr:hypothetical protein [Caulobacteraceae bacterium]
MKYKNLAHTIKEVAGSVGFTRTYKNLDSAIKDIMNPKTAEPIERHTKDQVSAGTYKTRNFEMSPEAQIYFSKIPKTVDANYIEKSAIFHDRLYGILRKVRTTGTADEDDVRDAEDNIEKIRQLKRFLPDVPDPEHLDKELDDIKSYVGKKGSPTAVPPAWETGEIAKDLDIDQKKFPYNRSKKMDRKIKISDDD